MSELRGLRALVTGGAGFIGSHLTDALLAAGAARVAAVDNLFLGRIENLQQAATQAGRFHLYREDCAEKAALDAVIAAEKPDVVFNLATKALLYSFFNPSGACKVNLDIALNLAESLRHGAFGRLLHVSTSEVYGSAVAVPMDESHPMLAETTYAAGKAAADLALAAYCNQYDLDVVTVRPFNNYGPRQNDGAMAAVIPLTVQRILRGEPPVIQGDGLQTRDFIYVGDTVHGLLKFATAQSVRGQVFNFASGRETSIRSIVETLAALLDYRGEFVTEPTRKADVRRHLAGVDRARAVVGEPAPTTLAEGLERTVAWYRGHNRR